MDEALQTLIATLLQLVLSQPQFLPAPGQPEIPAPVVQLMPQSEIAQAVCGQPCGVRAYYIPEKGVFIDAQLRFDDDAVARSILFHEIVHHVQHLRNRYSDQPECDRLKNREREAYVLQNQYLLSNREFVKMAGSRFDCPS
jgi:hypothetical protein